ncbi:MAG: sodium:solute symporter family protein [Lachnospiraceae bacterium]|nr:sodium:solute symporter family protein [Lachnospiraceae bacterium]
MTGMTFLGITMVLALVLLVGFFSGRRIKSAKDFLTGGGSGSFMVSGAIMGSLVSSQATIGTAQMAFQYGIAAWWFTLGAGIGCLILALFYVRPLREAGCVTELQIISASYGKTTESLGSVLSSAGTFFSVLSQVIACSGLMSVLFPGVSPAAATFVSVAVMCLYVIFGGVFSMGMGGMCKLLLLYLAGISGLVLTLSLSGGISSLAGQLRHLLAGTDLGLIQESVSLPVLRTGADVTARFGNILARGAAKDLGSGFSLMLGVLSTQTYAQAVFSAKNHTAARNGALISAFLTPPLGIAGIAVGIFMRTRFITQAEADALLAAGRSVPDMPVLAGTIQAFPVFAIEYLPPVIAGFVLGALLLSAIAGGAGLSLGIATVMLKDIFRRVTNRIDTSGKELAVTRGCIALVLGIAALCAILMPGSTINDFGFLSMGLRGTVIFMPLSCALWLKERVDSRFVLASILCAPVTVILCRILVKGIDPLIPGMVVSVLCCLCGVLFSARRKRGPQCPA